MGHDRVVSHEGGVVVVEVRCSGYFHAGIDRMERERIGGGRRGEGKKDDLPNRLYDMAETSSGAKQYGRSQSVLSIERVGSSNSMSRTAPDGGPTVTTASVSNWDFCASQPVDGFPHGGMRLRCWTAGGACFFSCSNFLGFPFFQAGRV